MIQEVKTSKGSDAITSDRWHVVHAKFTAAEGRTFFDRQVDSEHDDRGGCVAAARALSRRLGLAAAGEEGRSAVPVAERDEVFVRRPGFKTLKVTARRRLGSRRTK